ncbi:hypothetical protein CRG98_003079, partial [Punica granatum]
TSRGREGGEGKEGASDDELRGKCWWRCVSRCHRASLVPEKTRESQAAVEISNAATATAAVAAVLLRHLRRRSPAERQSSGRSRGEVGGGGGVFLVLVIIITMAAKAHLRRLPARKKTRPGLRFQAPGTAEQPAAVEPAYDRGREVGKGLLGVAVRVCSNGR